MKDKPNLFFQLTEALSSFSHIDINTFAKKHNVDRKTLLNMLNKLSHYGIHYLSNQKARYALKDPLWLLSEEKIYQHLNYPVDVIVKENTTSTNDIAMQNPSSSPFIAVLSETQQKGRGRFDREWFSPFGQNIYLSLRYRGEVDFSCLSGFSLVIALAVSNVLEPIISRPIHIKWPNDLFVDGKKLSGCLIELSGESHGVASLVIGVGVNVNQTEAPDTLKDWTSLKCISGNTLDRNQVVSLLINEIYETVFRFFDQGFQAFLPDIRTKDYFLNKKVNVKRGGKTFTGMAVGVSPLGYLLLEVEGTAKAFSSGEVSLVDY